jgi:ribosomal protein S18 acetylase RimI-like enzyme
MRTASIVVDPMGNGCDLSDDVQEVLIQRLRMHPTTRIFLAFDGKDPVDIATCFIGFSTFAARPLINIHDLHVSKDQRRRGIARRLLEGVQEDARELNCCKLTLEVQENNHPALALYRSLGFVCGQYQEEAGGVLFREKRL